MKIYLNTLSQTEYGKIYYYITRNRLTKYKDENNKAYILSNEFKAVAKKKRGKQDCIVATQIKYNSPEYVSLELTRLTQIPIGTLSNLKYYMFNTVPNKYKFYIDESGIMSIQYNRILKEYQEYKQIKRQIAKIHAREYNTTYVREKRKLQRINIKSLDKNITI